MTNVVLFQIISTIFSTVAKLREMIILQRITNSFRPQFEILNPFLARLNKHLSRSISTNEFLVGSNEFLFLVRNACAIPMVRCGRVYIYIRTYNRQFIQERIYLLCSLRAPTSHGNAIIDLFAGSMERNAKTGWRRRQLFRARVSEAWKFVRGRVRKLLWKLEKASGWEDLFYPRKSSLKNYGRHSTEILQTFSFEFSYFCLVC